MDERRTTIRDCTLGWHRTGDGVDLVWGHGLTASRALEDRDPFIEWTDVPARVHRYDARGHGVSDSTPDLDGYSWEQLAFDQLELATAIGVERYVAAGASMGAATALHAALIAPERILGLVLVIPPTGWETRAEQADLYRKSAHVVEQQGVEPVIRAGEALPPPDPFVGDPAYRSLGADALRSWQTDRLARVMRGATRAQLPPRDDVASIRCPTLVLAWTGDPGHPVSTADELDRLIPHSDVYVHSTRDELGHWTSLVREFVDRLGSTGD